MVMLIDVHASISRLGGLAGPLIELNHGAERAFVWWTTAERPTLLQHAVPIEPGRWTLVLDNSTDAWSSPDWLMQDSYAFGSFGGSITFVPMPSVVALAGIALLAGQRRRRTR